MVAGHQAALALHRFRSFLPLFAVGAGFVTLVYWLRQLPFLAGPLLFSYLESSASLIAIACAAAALVRFHGTHDRISLTLAVAFLLTGLMEMGSGLGLYGTLRVAEQDPLIITFSWMLKRILLASLFLAAIFMEKFSLERRRPKFDIGVALGVTAAVGFLTVAVYFGLPPVREIWLAALVPRAWDLLPAAIFLWAAAGYWRRLRTDDSASGRVMFYAAAINLACQLAVSQSERQLDAAFTFACILNNLSYLVVLGGYLLDNARLFDQMRRLAIRDPLTGVANYRRFVQVLEAEIKRSGRTGRRFAVLLFDLDELKRINDRYGHVVGSQALVRVANVLRAQCRAIDTVARYGGDEFALILPETDEAAARIVAERICQQVAGEGSKPKLSVSAGVAVHPRQGDSLEGLLHVADGDLYRMKTQGKKARVKQLRALHTTA